MTMTITERPTCVHCGQPFDPEPSIDARLKAKGSTGQKNCAVCVMEVLNGLFAEQVFNMSDEEIEAELRADGVDIEAFTKRTRELIEEAMQRRKGPRTNDGDGQ